MSETLSLDQLIAKLKVDAQEALKNVILENKQRFEAELARRQQHLIKKLNPDLIKFNVGGYKFVTTLEALSSIKDTKLHKMVTGRYPITLDAKDKIFIDRNGQYFGHVLDCLRKGQIELPLNSFLSSRVQKEFEFFELVNDGSSGSQKEAAKVNNATKAVTFGSQTNSGEHRWKFSSEVDDLGSYCSQDRLMIEAADIDRHAIGDTLLSSGTHQWRFYTEESIPKPLESKHEMSLYESIVTFGVVTKEMWEKIKDNREFEEMCGFNTIGATFKGDVGSKYEKGLKVDGPDFINEFGCIQQEFTLTLNTQTGVLKLDVKGQKKSYTLRINNSAGNEYYPYFHIENARLRLLESRELAEDEQDGMEVQWGEGSYQGGSDSEDIVSELSEAASCAESVEA